MQTELDFSPTTKDFKDFQRSERNILEFMKDGEWHDMDAIEQAATEGKCRMPSADRRMRALRQGGAHIGKMRLSGTRTFLYRLESYVSPDQRVTRMDTQPLSQSYAHRTTLVNCQ